MIKQPKLTRPLGATMVAGCSLIALLCVVVLGVLYALETHRAVCTWRGTLIEQQHQSREFLQLTIEQRKARFGSIGDIPDAAIKAGIASRQHAIDSLSGLHC